VMSET